MSGSEFSGFPNLRITRVMKDGKGSRDFWVEQSPGLQRVVHDHDQYILPMPWLYFRVQAFVQDYADEKKFMPARLRDTEMYESTVTGSIMKMYCSPVQLPETAIVPSLWPVPLPNVSHTNTPCGDAYRNGLGELPEEIDNMTIANLIIAEYWDQSFNTDYIPRHRAWRLMAWQSLPWRWRWLSLEGSTRDIATVFSVWEEKYTVSDVLNKWPWAPGNTVYVPSYYSPIGETEEVPTFEIIHTDPPLDPYTPAALDRQIQELLAAIERRQQEAYAAVLAEDAEDYGDVDAWQDDPWDDD